MTRMHTPREREILTHLSRDEFNKAIARTLDISHEAATPPGLTVTVTVELVAVEGRRLSFSVEAHDGVDVISRGHHERFVIDKAKFDTRVGAKRNGV